MPSYVAIRGLSYPPDKTAAPGDVVDDLPSADIGWLRDQGAIELLPSAGQAKTDALARATFLAEVFPIALATQEMRDDTTPEAVSDRVLALYDADPTVNAADAVNLVRDRAPIVEEVAPEAEVHPKAEAFVKGVRERKAKTKAEKEGVAGEKAKVDEAKVEEAKTTPGPDEV